MLFYEHLPYRLLSLIVAGIVIYAHRANIKRLKEGTESRFSWKNRGSRADRAQDSSRKDDNGSY